MGIEVGAFFWSNLIFMRVPEKAERREEIKRVMRSAGQNQLGILLYAGPEAIPEKVQTVHMIIEEPEEGWKIGTDLGKSDLVFLISYKLKQHWKSDLIVFSHRTLVLKTPSRDLLGNIDL